MNYKDFTPEEIRENIIEPIADLMISLAHANSDFICTECLSTLDKLESILWCLDSEVGKDTITEVNEIMGESL